MACASAWSAWWPCAAARATWPNWSPPTMATCWWRITVPSARRRKPVWPSAAANWTCFANSSARRRGSSGPSTSWPARAAAPIRSGRCAGPPESAPRRQRRQGPCRRSVDQLEGALHQGAMAGERAEERVVIARGQLGHVERHRIRLAAAQHLGVRKHARIAGFQVLVVQARGYAILLDRLHVGRLGQHPVVPHDVAGQLAGVLEVDRELLARLADLDGLL